MTGRSRVDFNALLVEGMIAFRGHLEERLGKPNPQAALGVGEAIHNLQPNPTMLNKVIQGHCHRSNLRAEVTKRNGGLVVTLTKLPLTRNLR